MGGVGSVNRVGTLPVTQGTQTHLRGGLSPLGELTREREQTRPSKSHIILTLNDTVHGVLKTCYPLLISARLIVHMTYFSSYRFILTLETNKGY